MLDFSIDLGERGKEWLAGLYIPLVSDEFCLIGYRRFLEILKDNKNGAVLYHCSAGKDRVGVGTMLFLSILGVSKEDLFRDYLFSNFGNIGGSRGLSRISDYVDAIDACEGATLAEKVETYLTQTIGVPQENIDKIREIMIEKNIVEV